MSRKKPWGARRNILVHIRKQFKHTLVYFASWASILGPELIGLGQKCKVSLLDCFLNLHMEVQEEIVSLLSCTIYGIDRRQLFLAPNTFEPAPTQI